MDTQLLDVIRTMIREVIREELLPIKARLDSHDQRFESLETTINLLHAEMKSRLKDQDNKLESMLEGWSIQKVHRQELDDHKQRITTIEHRMPTIG